MKLGELLIIVLIIVAAGVIGAFAEYLDSQDKATTRLQFDTGAAGVCTVEGGGKTFMVIDVTKEMSGEPSPEEVEGPKETE